jgi:hypothetical protein
MHALDPESVNSFFTMTPDSGKLLDSVQKTRVSSVKNFILRSKRTNCITMSFSKVGKNEFVMETRYPLSFVQACGMMISSVAKKIA